MQCIVAGIMEIPLTWDWEQLLFHGVKREWESSMLISRWHCEYASVRVCVYIYRDAVAGAVRPVCPGEGDVLGGPAPGEEGAGQPDVGAHQGVALPAGVNHYGLGVLGHCNTTQPDRRVGSEINTHTINQCTRPCSRPWSSLVLFSRWPFCLCHRKCIKFYLAG